MIETAIEARIALIAIYGGVEADPVAFLEVLNVFSSVFDNACCFMAHYQRGKPSASFSCVALNVGAANPAGFYTDEYVIIADGGVREVGVLELIGFSVNKSLQLYPFFITLKVRRNLYRTKISED